MLLDNDQIVDISPAREKFFGCAGKMLLPSQATVEALIKRIPSGRLATTDQFRASLLKTFAVQAVCPVTFRKRLQSIAKDPTHSIPIWRVIKPNGEILSLQQSSSNPNQAAMLEKEGFQLEPGKKHLRVENYPAHLLLGEIILFDQGIGPDQV